MKKIFSVLLAVALVLSFSLVTATPVAAATINVPGDYSTIQAAINAANPGDTIKVAAGTYDEQVVINRTLTLQGTGVTTVIKPSAANLTQAFTGLFWSGGTKNIAGIIVANVPSGSSVTIKNLKVDESLVTAKPAGADYLAGIFYRETGGLVDTVTVAGTGAWSSSDRAYGIYLSAGTNTVSVEITGSRITNFDKNGIEVMGGKLTADINHNTITGRGSITDEIQNGVNVGRDAVATVNYNTISKLIYQPKTWWAAGIVFYNYVSPTGVSATANDNNIIDCQTGIIFNNANASAEGNTVDGGTVGLIGIYAEPDAAGEWTAMFVGNTISGVRDSGSYQNAAIGANTYDSGATLDVTIQGNYLPGGGTTDADGISIGVEGADGTILATITNNTISGWQYGIRLDGALVDATSSCANSNSISGNDVFGVYNGGTGTLNATCNWWGDGSGPHHPTANPDGKGNDVSDKVVFTPWVVVPTVTTQPATDVRVYSATLNLDYTVGSCYGPAQVRFMYKKSAGIQWSYTDWVSKTADGIYAETLTGLDPNTGYQFKAQLEYNETLIAGNTLTFVTSEVPTVTTQAATNITSYSAVVNMSYTAGDFSSVEVRFACKRSTDPAWFYTDWVSGTANYTYTEVLTGLALRTEYEFKAQLRYHGTMIEGAARRFTTAPGPRIGFCFIATAAYGTPTAEQIDVLREFRDVVLLESTVGSQFVALYYRLSPPIADFIVRSDTLRTLVRELMVDPVVWIVEATRDMWRN